MDLRFLAQMHHIYDMQFSFTAAQLDGKEVQYDWWNKEALEFPLPTSVR